MNILMISPYFYPEIGGAEFAAYEVSKWLAQKGHKVRVVTKHFGEFKDYEVLNGIEVFRVRAKKIKGLQSLSAFPQMLRLSMRFAGDADVIHAHIPYPSAIIAYIIKKVKNKPYLITSQGSELFDYPEEKPLRLIKPIIGLTLRNADHIHVISRALKNSIVKNFGIHPEKITIIPNGVDLNLFNPSRGKKDHRRKEKIIVSVSRLTEKNGLDYLIKAMPEVLKKIDSKLIIVGDGDQRTYLENLIKKLGIENKVVLKGWVKYEEVPKIIASADLFVRTSITEGLGTAFLEAMACATPVIGSRVQGILDIIQDGYNGILVSPTDVCEISKGIIRVLEDDNLRESLIKNGLKFIEKYRWENISRQYLELYEKILSQSS
jgi:glycosyltransferase involved in cell wall biosynthesis